MADMLESNFAAAKKHAADAAFGSLPTNQQKLMICELSSPPLPSSSRCLPPPPAVPGCLFVRRPDRTATLLQMACTSKPSRATARELVRACSTRWAGVPGGRAARRLDHLYLEPTPVR